MLRTQSTFPRAFKGESLSQCKENVSQTPCRAGAKLAARSPAIICPSGVAHQQSQPAWCKQPASRGAGAVQCPARGYPAHPHTGNGSSRLQPGARMSPDGRRIKLPLRKARGCVEDAAGADLLWPWAACSMAWIEPGTWDGSGHRIMECLCWKGA